MIGEPALRKWHSAIIIQGPYMKDVTDIVVKTFLERNGEDVLLIVSTYLPPSTSVKDLISEFESNIIEGNSPYSGRLMYIFVRVPPPNDINFWRTNAFNQNLQRLSSFVGIRHALKLGIPLALKIRSDFFLGMNEVTRYLESRLVPVIPIPTLESKIRGRIVVSDYTRRPCDNPGWPSHMHFIPDNWFFGYTEDLLGYFDISSKSSWAGGTGIGTVHGPEHHLCEVWIRDMNLPPNISIDELTSRYMAIVDSVHVEAVWINRRHDYLRYLQEGKSYLLEVTTPERAYCYTQEAWEREVERLNV